MGYLIVYSKIYRGGNLEVSFDEIPWRRTAHRNIDGSFVEISLGKEYGTLLGPSVRVFDGDVNM